MIVSTVLECPQCSEEHQAEFTGRLVDGDGIWRMRCCGALADGPHPETSSADRRESSSGA